MRLLAALASLTMSGALSTRFLPFVLPKILIVHDDPDLRRGLNLRLRANHFDTAYATDGFSAITMAQKERPT